MSDERNPMRSRSVVPPEVLEAERRATSKNGHGGRKATLPKVEVVAERPNVIVITERHGLRVLVVAHIAQLSVAQDSTGTRFYVRCGGQELPVQETEARTVAAALGVEWSMLAKEDR